MLDAGAAAARSGDGDAGCTAGEEILDAYVIGLAARAAPKMDGCTGVHARWIFTGEL